MIINTEHLSYNRRTLERPTMVSELFSMHCHNTYELLFFEKGDASYIIDQNKYKLHKNDLVFIRPSKYHCIEFTGDSEYARINIAFTDSIVSRSLLTSLPSELEVIPCPSGSMLEGLFKRMVYYSTVLSESGFAEILTAMLTEIVYNLHLFDIDMAHPPSTLTPMLVRILEYVNDNLFTVKEIREISTRFHISEQYLFRLFQSQLHTSPYKYITEKRLMHAQALLRRGERPTDIHRQCGFDSYVSFYKQYVKLFGYSPSKELTTTRG